MQNRRVLNLAVIGLLLAGFPETSAGESPATVQDLASPASDNSAFPQLAEDGKGGVYMTWIETLKDGAGHRLRLAHRKEGGGWGEPSTVQEGKTFWRNWADFPGVGVFPDGSVMVHWLARSGEGTYDYNVNARISRDGGKTWGESFLVNTDGKQAEHGFASFAPTEKGLAVVWLDGRETKGMSHDAADHSVGGGAMNLRFAEFLSDGSRVREFVLDSKVCDCCQTAIVNTSKGLLAAYRDRSDNEFRDISFVRPAAEKVEPRDFSKDGWKINACPVNGPALAARGSAVSVAWFTMAGGKPRVRAAISKDGGDTFSAPLEVDAVFPAGRVDIAMLPSGESLLTWLGRDEGGAAIKAAYLGADGVLKPGFKVAAASIARAAGFPRLEPSGSEVVFAWTDVGPTPESSTIPPPSRVRTAVMSIP